MALRKSTFGTHAAQVPPAKFGSKDALFSPSTTIRVWSVGTGICCPT